MHPGKNVTLGREPRILLVTKFDLFQTIHIYPNITQLFYRFSETCEQFTKFWTTFSSLQILLSSGWIATVAVMIMERFGVTRNPLLKRATSRRMKIR